MSIISSCESSYDEYIWACPANRQPAWLKWNTEILEHETVDRIDFRFLSRFLYILRRSKWFVFKNYEKKW